jgi:hypothetical protein
VRKPPAAAVSTVAVLVLAASTACSSAAAADVQVGDCLKVGGPVDRPDAVKAICGTLSGAYTAVVTRDQVPVARPPLGISAAWDQRLGGVVMMATCAAVAIPIAHSLRNAETFSVECQKSRDDHLVR